MSKPQVKNVLGVSQKEFLIQLSSERLARVAQSLERNWMVQLVLAGVGFALVFDIGDLPKFLSRYVGQQEYSLRPVAAILLAIFLYYLMKLGRLLAAFLDTRKLNDQLLDEYLGEREPSLEALRATESFFEFFYAPDAFGRFLVLAYYFISAVIISTEQAAVLYLIRKAYGMWSVVALVPAVGIMVLLYIGFWGSKRKHRGTTAMVIAIFVMTAVLFAVFSVYA